MGCLRISPPARWRSPLPPRLTRRGTPPPTLAPAAVLAASSWHSPPMARWVSAIARGRNVCPVRTRRWLVKWSGDLSHPDRDGFSVLPRPGPKVGGVTRWAPNRWLAERDPA
jgi:hypothetical protein